MEKIDINNLSPDQLRQLTEQLEAKKKTDRERVRNERASYKTIVNSTVREQITKLHQLSDNLSLAKADIYRQFAAVIELKQDLYGSKTGQMSHTFTDDDGHSITIGWRSTDGFDDTLEQGVAKVREYIESLAVDKKSAKLVSIINKLLKKDTKGNLKASRIIDLENLAEEAQDPLLTEGVTIVRASYKPAKSVIFIEAKQKDELGKEQPVGLSITSVDFPEGYTPNLEVFK